MRPTPRVDQPANPDDRLAPPMPEHLQLEVTSACNLRCTMCLVRYRPPVNRLAGAMSPDLFRRVVDDVPSLRRLTLQGLGEPLLSPYLMEMLGYARSRNVTVGFNSNATLLTRDRAEALVRAGLGWLHVSLDGARAASYERVREGGDFGRVVANLAGLVQVRRAAASASPQIRVVFVAMRDNVDELPALIRLLARIGIDELHVQNLSHTFSDTDPAGRYAEIRRFAADHSLYTGAGRPAAVAAFAAARAAAEAYGVRLRLPRLAPRPVGARPDGAPGCGWPWEAAYVTSAGIVQPCCMVMGDDRIRLGDLTRQRFGEVWHGAPYREFRRRLLDPADPPEVCRGCALYRSMF